jgi:hypothetical protein
MAQRVGVKYPNEIPNLYGWYDMNDLTENETYYTSASTINDKSGNGNHILGGYNTGATTNSIIKRLSNNGNKVLDGSYLGMIPVSSTGNTTSAHTLFIVHSYNNTVNLTGLGCNNPAGSQYETNYDNVNKRVRTVINNMTFASPIGKIEYDQLIQTNITYNRPRVNLKVRTNEVNLTNNDSNAYPNFSFLLLNNRGAFGNGGNTKVAEIIIYNRPLSIDEVKQIERYLKFKWDLRY